MKNRRYGDPDAWKCLSDEQRDIIDDWFQEISETNRKEKNNIAEMSWTHSCLSILPIAVFRAYQTANGVMDVNFFLSVASTWVVYLFVFVLFRTACESFICEKQKWYELIWSVVCVLFATIIIIGAIENKVNLHG